MVVNSQKNTAAPFGESDDIIGVICRIRKGRSPPVLVTRGVVVGRSSSTIAKRPCTRSHSQHYLGGISPLLDRDRPSQSCRRRCASGDMEPACCRADADLGRSVECYVGTVEAIENPALEPARDRAIES